MLAMWWEQDPAGKERRERTSLAWMYVFLNIDPVQKKILKSMLLRFTTLSYPKRFSRACWNRNLLLRSHRSWFDRRALVNVASHDRGSCTRGPSRSRSRAETLSCQQSKRLALLHGSFMILHLFCVMCRESYPPWGKLVWRELSIMSFTRASSHISPDDIFGPRYPDLCVCAQFFLHSSTVQPSPGFLSKVPWVLFPM